VMCREEYGMCAVCGRCVGFLLASGAADAVSVRSVGDRLNAAYDGVVGRDVMCSCVQLCDCEECVHVVTGRVCYLPEY